MMIDKQLYESNGYLRSLPLVYRLSDENLKRAVTWEPGNNCNKPLTLSEKMVKFSHPQSFSKDDLLTCVFGNDEKDQEFKYIDKYVEFGGATIIVVNHSNFIPKNWSLSGKSIDSKSQYLPTNFDVELNKHLKCEGLINFQMSETKNLFFTELCKFHQVITSHQPRSLSELLNFEDDRLVISPMWTWLTRILLLKKENKVANMYNFIFNAFRPYLEKNKYVSEVATIFFEFLRNSTQSPNKLLKIREDRFKEMRNDYLNILNELTDEKMKLLIKKQMDLIKCQ